MWAAAVMMAPFGVAVVGLTIGLLLIVRRNEANGRDALDARAAQLEAERLKRVAEDQRDAELRLKEKAEADLKGALDSLDHHAKLLQDAEDELLLLKKEKIDELSGQDLVDAGAAVFGSSR